MLDSTFDESHALDIRDLTVEYPGSKTPVLSNITFSLAQHTRAALVGPNGSGKSTLLSALGGRLPYRQGHVRLLDRPINELQSSIAWIGADFDLFQYLTVEENARFVHAFSGRPWHRDEYRRLERRYALEGFSGQRAGSLSRGTKRKVQLLTALLLRPALLLADEPLDGLDEPSRALWEEDTATLAANGCVILSAVHDASYVVRTSDVVLTIAHGAVTVTDTRLGRAGPREAPDLPLSLSPQRG